MKQKPIVNCNLLDCLNNESGLCQEYLPNVLPKLKPNDKLCYQFETKEERLHHYENLKKRLKFEAEELAASEPLKKEKKKDGRKD